MAIPIQQYLSEATHRDQPQDGREQSNDCDLPLQAYRRDRYFNDISDLIDAHPIGRPMATSLTAKP